MFHRIFLQAMIPAGLALLSLGGCNDKPTPPEPQTPAPTSSQSTSTANLENAVVLNFRVEGMHCGGCATALKSKLAKLDGVLACDASFAEKSATVTASDPSVADAVLQVMADQKYTAELLNEKPAGDDHPEAAVTQPQDESDEPSASQQ